MHQYENSYGIIPLKRFRGEWKVLFVKHGKGHWALPKGHAEEGEKPEETAIRELEEETGLKVKAFLNIPAQHEHYFFKKGDVLIEKTVTYFAAKVTGKVIIQEAEIAAFKWLTFEEATQFATFQEAKKLCERLKAYLC
jgi:8-oxo-dGTP pyrophosphatase MutT (NUDIX family)